MGLGALKAWGRYFTAGVEEYFWDNLENISLEHQVNERVPGADIDLQFSRAVELESSGGLHLSDFEE